MANTGNTAGGNGVDKIGCGLKNFEKNPLFLVNSENRFVSDDLFLPSSSSLNFTRREEDLQKLLLEERKRSEQRRNNYSVLKAEHLKIQQAFLGLQTEMKQILEETMTFKEKKTIETEDLLKNVETKTKQIEKLEKALRENDPEVLKIKMMAEIEEPIKKMEKEKDLLIKKNEKLSNELRLFRTQQEHMEKEHLDSIEKVKLSYEAEINLLKREKEEIRTRLIEASQSPDVKRLIDLNENNNKLNKKLISAQQVMEQAEQRYKLIENKIEELIVDHQRQLSISETKIKQLADQLDASKEEAQKLKNDLKQRRSDNEELLDEIGCLKRTVDKVKFDLSQKSIQFNDENELLKSRMQNEFKVLSQEKTALENEIKKLGENCKSKNETIMTLEKLLKSKDLDAENRIKMIIDEETERTKQIELKKKLLETTVQELTANQQKHLTEIDRLKHQVDHQTEQSLTKERDNLLLRAKIDSQTVSIEELEKIRRQHSALHDEVNRLRSETYDLMAIKKELTRINQNNKEEYGRLKEQFEEERRNIDEQKILNEKIISKLTNRFEEERNEFRLKLNQLERENIKLKAGIITEQETYKLRFDDYSRLKAKQYSKLADRLNSLLENLKSNDKNPSNQID